MLSAKNQPVVHAQDFFDRYKGVILLGAIIVLAVILTNQSKQCPAPSSSTGKNVSDVGGKALQKLLDVGITKGVASLFK